MLPTVSSFEEFNFSSFWDTQFFIFMAWINAIIIINAINPAIGVSLQLNESFCRGQSSEAAHEYSATKYWGSFFRTRFHPSGTRRKDNYYRILLRYNVHFWPHPRAWRNGFKTRILTFIHREAEAQNYSRTVILLGVWYRSEQRRFMNLQTSFSSCRRR